MQKAKKGEKKVVKKSAAVKLMETVIGRKLLAGQKNILALIEPMFESVNEDIRALEQSHNNDVDGIVEKTDGLRRSIDAIDAALVKSNNHREKHEVDFRQRFMSIEKRLPDFTKVEQDIKIMENGWMLQARVIEGLHAEDKRLHEDIDRFLGRVDHCEGRQANMLGRIIMGEQKTKYALQRSDSVAATLAGLKWEAWYWTVLTSAALGIAFGLLAVVSSKTI